MLTLCFGTLLFCSEPCRAQSESQEFEAILTQEWATLIRENPILAIYLGQESPLLWPDSSRAARDRTADHYSSVLKRLGELNASQLSERQRVDLRLFRQQLGWQVERHQRGLDLFTMNQQDGVHTTAGLADSIAFAKIEDFERWVEMLESFGDYIDGEIAVLKDAVTQRRVHPKIITERLLERVRLQVDLAADPKESAYLEPFREAAEAQQQDSRFSDLEQRAQVAVVEVVGPAFSRLANYLAADYLDAAPDRVGLGQLPGGREAYAFLIRRYTTTERSASEIHELGLKEVARIRTRMDGIRQQVGFAGDLGAFFEHLRTSPEFYPKSSEELLLKYRAFCKRVDGQMPRFFKTLPRRPYGVEPIPDYIAPATTTAYYLPGAGYLAGTYSVNLYQPQTRALFEIPALSMHESVPGHHQQISLTQEIENLPDFRRYFSGFGDYTVFVEGWALYAESLGEEMGLYEDPYDLFGRYTYEIWRAIRLVIDTGIHDKGWTRQQAIDYFLANSPRSELDITNEVDRYIAWPGQALAYKMGELKISELRRYAEAELEERFDIREFHDAVLLQGAVPLDQLEDQVKAYVRSQQEKRGPKS